MTLNPSDRARCTERQRHTATQLEAFYAVPQIGAVLVPINIRLKPEEIAYIVDHSGASVICAHADYLEALEPLRDDRNQTIEDVLQ